jgi:hypothetical protein
MRKVCQIIAAAGLIAGLGTPASANTFTFVTPTGSTTGGGPVNASVTFTTGLNSLVIVLDDLQANPTDVAQLLSDLLFTVSDTTLNAGSVTSSSGQQVTIAANGTPVLGATVATGWQVTPLGSGQFHLNDLCGGCAGPAQLIIGPPDGLGKYSSANGSIAGNGPHNPFLNQEATFTIGITGLTATDSITAATFSFGTTAGINVPGVPGCPDCGPGTHGVTPEPASLVLLGSGLLGAGVRRWRTRRTAA